MSKIRIFLSFFAMCMAVFVTVPANAAFSLVHKTGIYDALQENGMQSVHTDYQILYAKPGESVHLYRPERSTFAGYVRWYCYDTDRAVPAWYTEEDSPTGVAIPRIQSLWEKDTLAATLKFKAKNDYGWFGYTLIGGSGKATKGDENYVELKYTMHNGDSIYRIACDQGIWNDYSPTTWNNNATMTEPTLSKRIIFEIRPASWMADSLELCKDMDGTNDRYLEEHELIAPTGRQLYIGPNMMCLGSGDGNKITLKQYTYYALTNYYYINSQSNVTAAGDKSKWKWYVDGVYSKSGFSTKSSQNSAQFIEFSSSTPGTVVYTLKYNSATGVYFNVARFKVTYMDVDVVGPSTNIPAPTKKMERIYEETFNYDEPNTTNFAFWSGHYDVDESTYGYYNKSMDGSPSLRQTEKGKITWSEYAVTNRKSVWVSSGETAPQVYQHVDSTENIAENAKKGYMLYCDGSQQPGQVFNLKVDADLCPGSTMYFSAWVCDASSTGSGNSAPNLDFIVTGIDALGKEHPLTTFTTGEFGINAVNKVGESAKMERAKWYQIMFPVKFETKTSYVSYRLRITNKSTSSDGNDFAIDDIRIYVLKPPVMPIQASTSDCVDKALDSIRAYLRIDYQEIEHNGEPIYYQWREGDNILRFRYSNKDSVSTTFGCIPILTTDAEIEASGLTSHDLLAFDATFRETEDPVYRYIKEKVDNTTERYVLYVAQPIEVRTNYTYTGFVATSPESLGSREGCGTFADMLVAGGTRIIIDDDISLGDSVVSVCGHRSYTLNIVLTQIIRDETDPYDPLKIDTTHCRADWLIGDSAYVNEHPEVYRNSFDDIQRLLILYRGVSVPQAIRDSVDYLLRKGLLTLDTSSISMQAAVSLSYTAFPLAGSAGSKQVCTSPRFLHIKPAVPMANMMAVGGKTEVLPEVVSDRPRVVRISNAQKSRGSFSLPLFLKGDEGEIYEVDSIYMIGSTKPNWRSIRLNADHTTIAYVDTVTLSGAGLASLEAGYDYTFHIAFIGENSEDRCDRGYTYFTLRIVPDVVTWQGGEWNVDANWDTYMPMDETNVILKNQDYAVTFSADPAEAYDFNYKRNHCHHIYLPDGASMAGQENVEIGGQAFIDVKIPAEQYTLMSFPLQGVVSGDIFASQAESASPFSVAAIRQAANTDADDRYTYEVFNSAYYAPDDHWLIPTNTLTRPMPVGDASMIGIDCAEGAADPIVRLPKQDDMYRYFDGATAQWLDSRELIYRDENYGKPAFDGNSTITLKEVYNGVYLFGNPTFGYIDITRLVADNADKLTGRYSYQPVGQTTAPSRTAETVFNGDATTDDPHLLLPPYRGILLEGKSASDQLTINVSSAMVTEAPERKDPRRIPIRSMRLDINGGEATGEISGEPKVVRETDYDISEFFTPLMHTNVSDLTIYRTLDKDGYFNTICLPFDLPTLEGTDLEGGQLYTFVEAEVVNNGSGYRQLNHVITPVNSLKAGVPYLISWPNTGETITVLNFSNVEIKDALTGSTGDTDGVQFVGNVARKRIDDDSNHSRLFLGADNRLYWPAEDDYGTMKGFRAYFYVQTDGAGPRSVPRGTPARLVIRQRELPTSTGLMQDEVVCEKVIENGVLYIKRGENMYNAQGAKIK